MYHLGVLLVVAYIGAMWLGPWVFDRLNPPFVPPAHAQQCGSITAPYFHPSPPNPNLTSAENCFWLAYQTCRTAVLSVKYQDVDSFALHNFVLQKQSGHCALSDYVQGPVGARSIEDMLGMGYKVRFLGLYQGKGLQQVGKGLRFVACGSEGNIDLDTGQGRAQGRTWRSQHRRQPHLHRLPQSWHARRGLRPGDTESARATLCAQHRPVEVALLLLQRPLRRSSRRF